MTTTLWMAVSLNGMAAREDQSEDFLSKTDWEMFLELVRACDGIIWGRVTHQLFEQSVRSQFAELPIVVVTQNSMLATKPGSIRASSPQEAVALLTRRGASRILLAGGSQLNAAFAREGLIDEVILAIEPVVVAKGIPMVAPNAADLRLSLVGIENSRNPTLRLHYRVLKS